MRRLAVIVLLLAASPASAGWLESGLEALAGRLGVHPRIGVIEKAPGGGALLRRVELSRPGLSVSMPEVRLTLDWKALVQRRLEIVRLDIPELIISVESSSAPASAPSKSAWSLAARAIHVGVMRGRWSGDGEPLEWSVQGLDASYAADRLAVRKGRVFIAGSTASVSGWMLADGTAADVTADLSGRAAGRVRIARDDTGWSAQGRPVWEGLSLEGKAALAPDGNWTAKISVAGMERRAPAWTKRLGAVRGQASASGRGFDARGRGQAKFLFNSPRGISASGAANWKGKTHAGSGKVSGLGLEGGFSWRGTPKKSTGSWVLSGVETSLSPIGVDLKLSSTDIHGYIESRPAGWHMTAQASATGLRTGKIALDQLSLNVQGSTQAHTLVLIAETSGTTVTATGKGRWAGDAWKTRWEATQLTTASATARGVGTLSLSPGRVDIHGSVEGVNLAHLPAKHSLPAGLGGSLASKVSLSGPPQALAGGVSWSVSEAMVAGIGPGTIRGEGEVSSGTVVLRECRWESGQAWATLSGSAPITSTLELPDYDLRLEVGGMEQTPLTISHEWLEADDLVLHARMRLKRTGGKLLSDGSARARASALRLPPWKISLAATTATVVADGELFQVAGQALDQDGSSVRADGLLSLAGPELKLTTDRLVFSPRPGTEAEASLALSLTGTWSALRLAGQIVLLRADIGPPPKPGIWRRWFSRLRGKPRVQEPAKASPEFPPRLAANVKISFDRQVWYKEGATSVEVRGALHLRREPPADPQIFGSIETLRGRLVYYGRTFELRPSRVDFAGLWPPDPQVDAQALYIEERSRTRIQLALTGPLSSPRASLSSEPPLDERDILSVLAIGHPLDDRGEAGESSAGREAAERVMASYASQSVRQNLLGRLNLDVFQFQLDHERRSHLTMGRYISRDLFISVENSFGSDGQHSVKAEYTLSPIWSIELSRTNLGYSVIDLFYRKGFF